jgi:sterol desaturase/sphingolipid hydroxylase (fatty acid hydroxylase superfamily)
VGQVFLEREALIRISIFVGIFALIALWEILAPRRVLVAPKQSRWANNLGLTALNTVLLRLIFPLTAAGMAAFCAAHGWGIFNQVHAPTWLALVVSLVLMDLAIWLQHWIFHAFPVLWRLHRVHHADLDLDLTTGARFHPIEMVLSMALKVALIAMLGAPVVAVVIFEVILNAAALFNHGNVRVPIRVDRLLRWIIVTPDMHRVHHSTLARETNSNFGFNLPWWDRLFGTYCPQPLAGHIGMTIGQHGYTNPQEVIRMDGLLLMPFKSESGQSIS